MPEKTTQTGTKAFVRRRRLRILAVLVGALPVTTAFGTAVARGGEPLGGVDPVTGLPGHQPYHCSIHHGEFCVYDTFPTNCTGDAGELVKHGATTSVDGVKVRCNDGNMCVEATGSCVRSPARKVPGGMRPNRYNAVSTERVPLTR